jgi:hypothetical protein
MHTDKPKHKSPSSFIPHNSSFAPIYALLPHPPHRPLARGLLVSAQSLRRERVMRLADAAGGTPVAFGLMTVQTGRKAPSV